MLRPRSLNLLGGLSHVLVLSLMALSAAPTASAQVWEVGNRLLLGTSNDTFAGFGTAVVLGDFDGDGDLDLAVGEPGASVVAIPFGTFTRNGKVTIYRNQGARVFELWYSTYSMGAFGDNRWAGTALAAGDFDSDGKDELTVGIPGDSVGASSAPAGAVALLEWVTTVSSSSWQETAILSQASTPTLGVPEPGDRFGETLVTGDFDGDGVDDLAVGVPQEDFGTLLRQGVVQIFYGGVWGFDLNRSQLFAPGYLGVLGTPNGLEEFSHALAAGDFDGDTFDDLAIGAPFRTVPGPFYTTGQVHVLRGSAGGLGTNRQLLLEESSFGSETPNSGANFGRALAAGEFDGPPTLCLIQACTEDLAIGIPGKTVSGQAYAGKVLVAYGTANGFDTASGTYTNLTQNSVAGATPETDDYFGLSLAAGRLTSSSHIGVGLDDLVVGAPFEKIGPGVVGEGFVQLFFGSTNGVDGSKQEQVFGQKAGFAIAPPVANDHFGEAFAIGDLDGDGWGDLVVGTPDKKVFGVTGRGAVQVLYGAMFADGFESGGTGNWSSSP